MDPSLVEAKTDTIYTYMLVVHHCAQHQQ